MFGYIFRKLIHIAQSIIPVLYLTEIIDKKGAIIIGIVALVFWLTMDLIRYTYGVPKFAKNVVTPVDKKHFFNGGVLALIVGLLLVFFFSRLEAGLAMLVIGVADPMAALIGKYFGKKKLPYADPKSYLGFTVFVICAFLCLVWWLPLWQAIIIALVSAFVESYLDKYIDDNISVPLNVALMILLFGMI